MKKPKKSKKNLVTRVLSLDKYNHLKIEKKWQNYWAKKKLNKAVDFLKKKKFYGLIEFPYPSGEGLHVGHIRSNTAMDIIARKRRAEGYNVLYPIGWDAFGLPTENYAIKTGVHPTIVTKKNTDTFRKQLKACGFSFDWDREINTTDPKYYKWTQWIFLKMFEKGLAYKKKMPINWCPSCKIGLANEEVVEGKCERCGTITEKKEKEQWMLAITKYAERLDKDLDDVDYLPVIKTQQRNWIGRNKGAELGFKLKGSNSLKFDFTVSLDPRKFLNWEVLKVFTTRPDTLYGVTYLVLSPEHELVSKFAEIALNKSEIFKYVGESKKKSEIERTNAEKEKTGVEVKGIKAINPVNKEEVPIWIADYVLADYGTGAVMAVPAHDQRDYDFAKKYNLPIKEVVIPERIDKRNPPVPGKEKVERRNVHAIVKNPKDGKYLCLKWKKFPWITLPMGGVEEGEDVISAAKREVKEETGYKNLINAKVLGGQVRAEYFAAHKDQNRVSFTNLVYFELENDEREDISQKEKDDHDYFWADRKNIDVVTMVHAEMDVWLDRIDNNVMAYEGHGVLVNSYKYNGKDSTLVMKEITEHAGGMWATKFKLRDWVFSRQRYWGEPIPVIHCPKCGIVPVKEKDLPVKLPNIKNYKPVDNGESPLSLIEKWVNVKCPQCKGNAKRETDTMPNWAGSSWYYLRYTDPKNSKKFADFKKIKYWTPVDWYNGGMEHVTLHLLYSRFWHKFLYDQKLVPTNEPYKKRTSHGLILAEGGVKMSKSKGNVINPDDIIKRYGADSLRLYEMFMGPFDQAITWNEDGIVGMRRFIERVWKLSLKYIPTNKLGANTTDNKVDLEIMLNQTIKKVTEDIEGMKFNTAISQMMILFNQIEKSRLSSKQFEKFIKILSPFAPHITEEIWLKIGKNPSVHLEGWPRYNQSKIMIETAKIMIQINGKVRGSFEAGIGLKKEDAERMVMDIPGVKKWVVGKEIAKIVYVDGKIINIVTK